MSRLTRFYLGERTDTEGRLIEEIWEWSDEDWEDAHDFIQWLFPTPTRSAYNPDAPLLTHEAIAAFHADKLLQDRLKRSLLRFLSFLGLAWKEEGQVIEGQNFAGRQLEVWAYFNHNWLRISRVLTSLRLLGLGIESQAFFAWLDAAYKSGKLGAGDSDSHDEATASHQRWAECAKGS